MSQQIFPSLVIIMDVGYINIIKKHRRSSSDGECYFLGNILPVPTMSLTDMRRSCSLCPGSAQGALSRCFRRCRPPCRRGRGQCR